MTQTPKEMEFLQLVQSEADARGVDSGEYVKAMLATLREAQDIFPGDMRRIQEYAFAILDEKYPLRKDAKV